MLKYPKHPLVRVWRITGRIVEVESEGRSGKERGRKGRIVWVTRLSIMMACIRLLPCILPDVRGGPTHSRGGGVGLMDENRRPDNDDYRLFDSA